MAVNLSPVGGAAAQFFDNNGNPLTGGKIYTYAAGTTTNQATYTSAAGTTAHTNPIVLDAAGRVSGGEIWLTDGLVYKFVLKTSTEVLIGTYDNIVGINDVNACDIEYTPSFTGAVETAVCDKLEQYVSIKDFGAVGNGVANDTSAIQAALNSGATDIYVPSGTYNYSSQLTISSTLRLYGEGTFNETTLLTQGILVDSADGVRIEGIAFTGPETLAAWNSGGSAYRQSYKSFIKFDNCKNGVVDNVISSGKRGTVWLLDCQKMTVQGIRHNGFLGNLTFPPVADSNYYEVVFVQDGLENRVLNCQGFSCGNVVLIGLDSSYNIVSEISGREIQDALIYNSSGTNSTFTNSTVNVCTNGLVIRGSSHTVANNVIFDSDQLGISLTGNGSTPDGYNANGFGTVCTGNTLSNTNGYAIATVEQDGLYPRDFIISDNTVEAHVGTGGFSPFLINGERGMKVSNNTVVGSTSASYAYGIFGQTGNRALDFDISGNIATDCVVGFRFQNVDDSLVSNNTVSINSSFAFDFRLCDDNFITGSRSSGANGIRLSNSAGEECLNNVCVNNDVPNQSGQAANVTALPIEYETATWTPTYTATSADFTSVTYDAETQGYYTKVGQLVTISGFIRTDAITVGGASGDVIIGGLPFAVSNNGTGVRSAVSLTLLENFAGDYPSSGFLQRNETVIRLQYRTAANGDDIPLAIADLGTGADANGFAFSATYITDL